MRKICVFLTMLVASSLSATEQVPDILIFEGKTYYIHAFGKNFPLEPYFQNGVRPEFREDNKNTLIRTSCRRGYKAIWYIQNKQLILISIDTFVNGKKMGVADIVGKHIFANWFSGDVRVRQYNKPWSPMKIFSFENGILKKVSDHPIRIIPTEQDVSMIPNRVKRSWCAVHTLPDVKDFLNGRVCIAHLFRIFETLLVKCPDINGHT